MAKCRIETYLLRRKFGPRRPAIINVTFALFFPSRLPLKCAKFKPVSSLSLEKTLRSTPFNFQKHSEISQKGIAQKRQELQSTKNGKRSDEWETDWKQTSEAAPEDRIESSL